MQQQKPQQIKPLRQVLVFRDLKLFPSLNIALKEHWAARKKRKDKLWALIKAQNPVKFPNKVLIRYVRYACKLQDWDNHCGSFKSAGDALILAKVIIEDNPDVIKPFLPEQERVKTKAEEKIVIIIEQIF